MALPIPSWLWGGREGQAGGDPAWAPQVGCGWERPPGAASGARGPSCPHSASVPALLPADRLLSLTLLAFEGLNTAASKDRCLACIEEPFFSPLWPLLLAVYRYGPAACAPLSCLPPRSPQVLRACRRCHAHPPTARGVASFPQRRPCPLPGGALGL